MLTLLLFFQSYFKRLLVLRYQFQFIDASICFLDLLVSALKVEAQRILSFPKLRLVLFERHLDLFMSCLPK